MPLSLRRGRVTAVLERAEGFARLEVDAVPCVAYPRITGPVGLDDDVLVNVQARVLSLGSGGFDVLYANLTRGLGLRADPGAHVMTLPYTPLQAAVRHVEEDGSLAETLDGLPVVCCSLHSQVAPVCAGIGDGVRVAYVQLPGGALPVSVSDALRALKRRGLLETAIAAGPCVDGDVQCVGVHSALGGRPVIAVRRSERDARVRHRGVSHHTRAVLDACLGVVKVAWPEEVGVEGWEEACRGLPLDYMGRAPAADPSFFSAAFAAGRLARSML